MLPLLTHEQLYSYMCECVLVGGADGDPAATRADDRVGDALDRHGGNGDSCRLCARCIHQFRRTHVALKLIDMNIISRIKSTFVCQ